MNSRFFIVTLALVGIACGESSPPGENPDPEPTAKGGINAGNHHTCGFNAAGETWCWGRNQYGELGSASNASPVPVQARISDLVAIGAGTQATCGLKADGALWCWGRILGESESNLRSPPRHVSVFGTDVRNFDMASSTVYALKTDGSIWAFSNGNSRQLVAQGAEQFSVLSYDPVCFRRGDGTIACQGDNDSGMLGNGTTTDSPTPVQVLLPGPGKQVSAGGNFACAVTADGEVWCWGANEDAQTGTRQSTHNCNWSAAGATPCNPTPVKVNGLPAPARAVETGYDFALALLTDGTVWGWGNNEYFQLGKASNETCTSIFGTEPCSSTPIKLPLENMLTLSAGDDHACGCDKDGTAWCWGDSASGKLGTTVLPNPDRAQSPVKPQGFRCW